MKNEFKKVSLLKTLKAWSLNNLYFYFQWELFWIFEQKKPAPVDRVVIDVLFDIMRDSIKNISEPDLEILKKSEDFSNWFDAIRLWVTSDKNLQEVFCWFDCYRKPLDRKEVEDYKEMAKQSQQNENLPIEER